MTADDLFDSASDATGAEIALRDRAWAKQPEKGCGLGTLEQKKKRANLNPRQQEWFARNGYTFARVEHANAWGAVTVDLWGFADYLAVRPGEILLVQVTTLANAAAREKKARGKPELRAWLKAGGRFQVHAWRQPGGPGTRWENVVREVREA